MRINWSIQRRCQGRAENRDYTERKKDRAKNISIPRPSENRLRATLGQAHWPIVLPAHLQILTQFPESDRQDVLTPRAKPIQCPAFRFIIKENERFVRHWDESCVNMTLLIGVSRTLAVSITAG